MNTLLFEFVRGAAPLSLSLLFRIHIIHVCESLNIDKKRKTKLIHIMLLIRIRE